ncbi:hypothetical protein Xen7305DRAFT_00006120, partial [Xenococcus sp. PCC 7305]
LESLTFNGASPLKAEGRWQRAEGSGETPRRRQAQGNAHQERGQKDKTTSNLFV